MSDDIVHFIIFKDTHKFIFITGVNMFTFFNEESLKMKEVTCYGHIHAHMIVIR